MKIKKLICLLLTTFILVLCASCNENNKSLKKPIKDTLKDFALENYLVEKPNGLNSLKSQKSPYVLLISIDGFRHDYIDLYTPKHLMKFKNQSSWAKSLTPVFPSKTFTNHLSIITGSYPENHGIIANSFFDPTLNRIYSLGRRKEVANGQWYTRAPIWVELESKKMLTACFFWPGSSAKIDGFRPSYYLKYFHKMPHEIRINKVVDWLKLPQKNRPHFLTLYFSDVDSAGHKYGPYSSNVKNAIKKVDDSLGILFNKLQKLDLDINIIIVSDHGMLDLNEKKFQKVTDKVDLEKFHIQGTGPVSFLYYVGEEDQKKKVLKKTYDDLKYHSKYYQVYKRSNLPSKFRINNERAGDLILVSYPNYALTFKGKRTNLKLKGNHGYDPHNVIDMRGIFMAKGNLYKENYQIESFENIHIYPMILKSLGQKQNLNIDGRLEVLNEIFR